MSSRGFERSYLNPKRREALLSEVKKIIRCIILSTRCRITCEEVATDYKDLEGQSIPFKHLGFYGLHDFLKSISDVVHYDAKTDVITLVDDNGLHKSDHVRVMVTHGLKRYTRRQRFVSHAPRAVYTPRDSAPGTEPRPFCTKKDLDNRDLFVHNDIQLYALRLVNNTKGLDVKLFEAELNKFIEQSVNFLYGNVKKLLTQLSHLFYVRNQKIYPNLSCYADDVKNFGKPGSAKFVSLVPLRTKHNLSELLAQYPHGILWYELMSKYQEMHRMTLEFSLYGFNGVMQMVLSMPTVCLCKEVWKEYHFFDARQPYPPAPQVTPRAITNAHKLLSLFRGVVDLKYFQPLYELVFGETFNHVYMKFTSLEEALCSLKSEGIVIVPDNNDRLALLDSSKRDTIPAVHPFLGVKVPRGVVYPEGVMTPNDILPRLVLPEGLQEKQTICLLCLDSFGPQYFFARCLSYPYYKLKEMISLIYDKKETNLQMPPNAYTLGLVCASPFGGGIQRVMIVALPKHTPEFLILRLDYGGIMSVKMGTLFYLPKVLAQLPAQAFLCSLVGIMPPLGGDFTPDCVGYFNKVIYNQLVSAQIHTIDKMNLEVSLTMTTMLGVNKVNVAQELINKGFAEPSNHRKPMRHADCYAFWLLYERMYNL